MIDQSTKTIDELLLELTSNSNGYYIEQSSIATKVNISGHTTYSRFKYFSGKVTKILLEQHKSKIINLAIPLKGFGALVLEYSGKHQNAFVSLVSHFIKDYRDKIYITTQNNFKITLYIKLKNSDLKSFLDVKKQIISNLESRLENEWLILPNSLNPDIGNILILPREVIEI